MPKIGTGGLSNFKFWDKNLYILGRFFTFLGNYWNFWITLQNHQKHKPTQATESRQKCHFKIKGPTHITLTFSFVTFIGILSEFSHVQFNLTSRALNFLFLFGVLKIPKIFGKKKNNFKPIRSPVQAINHYSEHLICIIPWAASCQCFIEKED